MDFTVEQLDTYIKCPIQYLISNNIGSSSVDIYDQALRDAIKLYYLELIGSNLRLSEFYLRLIFSQRADYKLDNEIFIKEKANALIKSDITRYSGLINNFYKSIPVPPTHQVITSYNKYKLKYGRFNIIFNIDPLVYDSKKDEYYIHNWIQEHPLNEKVISDIRIQLSMRAFRLHRDINPKILTRNLNKQDDRLTTEFKLLNSDIDYNIQAIVNSITSEYYYPRCHNCTQCNYKELCKNGEYRKYISKE